MGNLKPIETNYRGIRFRSKLEAQWAVFFDECKLEWEYEPQGFKLPNGKWYLPDFLLHHVNYQNYYIDLFVEVKGYLSQDDKDKITNFSLCAPILTVGSLPWGQTYQEIIEDIKTKYKDTIFFNSSTIDGFNDLCILGKVSNDSNPWGFYDPGIITSNDDYRAEKANTAELYYNARNYRFDHRNKQNEFEDEEEFFW